MYDFDTALYMVSILIFYSFGVGNFNCAQQQKGESLTMCTFSFQRFLKVNLLLLEAFTKGQCHFTLVVLFAHSYRISNLIFNLPFVVTFYTY